MKSNAILMKQARESLAGKWGMVVGVCFVYLLMTGSLKPLVPVYLILSGPLAVGLAIFSLAVAREKKADISQLFQGFNRFGVSLGAWLLMALFVTLWTLLLVIPGMIAAISYSQTFFILAEGDSIGSLEALRKSQKMMAGYKWKYFCLGLRFFGWFIVSTLTFGIGFFWLFPYIQISLANFYDDLKGKDNK